MKRLIQICGFILASIFLVSWYQRVNVEKTPTQPSVTKMHVSPKEKQRPASDAAVTTSIFIPYWNIPNSLEDTASYDELYYFGVAPDENGELIDDSGFTNLEAFVESTTSEKKRLLTIRMLNTEINSSILQDSKAQDLLISQTLRLVEEYEFDGVVLDLEMGVIPFDNVTSQITTFVTRFSGKAKEGDRQLFMTIYGDTFYRQRPYDIEKLEPVVDRFLVMAYDFHKSRGEPGPNFPFDRRSGPPLNPLLGKEGNERGGYPYSFEEMVSDFTSVVPAAKITVLFGMYGYDWTLGPQGLPLKSARAIPLNQIDAEGAITDQTSQEKHILYTDDEGYKHVLWYEDLESVDIKIKYLNEKGIGSVGYWVLGYF